MNTDKNPNEGMRPATGTELLPSQIETMKVIIESAQPAN